MGYADFRKQVLSGAPLAGTFIKTPSIPVIEVLAQSGLDFACLDAEHAPFDRAALDACIAVARALDFPMMVRVGDASPREILQALDYGAVGVIVPHVETVAQAEAVARSARFGLGGRGYAGSSRWAAYGTQTMPQVLAQSLAETVVLTQIEEPAAVDVCEEIAAVEGVDGLFVGPADLSVGYGHTDIDNDDVKAALTRVGDACRAVGKGYASFVGTGALAQDWAAKYGVSIFCIASEHTWMRQGAAAAAAAVHDVGD
ncbi:HpcH/HpaI aldolase family protein [Antarctobacter heliothermus]|uniref:2-keto-3-deoxy-L-rhamnonate aldolase RhmA n=1 Tax=Antarctobacter heliothermus TaxID=74033 RepID=A0A239G0V9_9RHOB|nr:aldolase/citrate lyase family protein [Antarctobacter heliothermus]SNS62801.1 2-keto-3-deoxy-L-rhamnonate aldolase RhmA [Antarctobacter heliothermus]